MTDARRITSRKRRGDKGSVVALVWTGGLGCGEEEELYAREASRNDAASMGTKSMGVATCMVCVSGGRGGGGQAHRGGGSSGDFQTWFARHAEGGRSQNTQRINYGRWVDGHGSIRNQRKERMLSHGNGPFNGITSTHDLVRRGEEAKGGSWARDLPAGGATSVEETL